MITIIKTLNLNRKTTAILENAYTIGYEKQVNAIWQASFSLPINDPKVGKVELLKYVEIDEVGLFRIMPKKTSKSSNSVTFQCEHVLSTLLNSVLFKYHQLSNYTTTDVLQYLLSHQKEKHWKLGVVSTKRYFHYSWENENLLSALFSVPKPIDEQLTWTFDTTSYPWTLNLVHAETEPTCRIKERHNLVNFDLEENPMSVYNRIYPLGAGEGVNQLGIESVNNGVAYIEDDASIAQNGVIETIWPDKRFTDASSLKASAETLLKRWKEPIVSWSVSAADVSKLTGAKIDELKEGKVVRLQLDDYPTTDLRIMKESKSDMTGSPGNIQLEIGNVSEDLGTTLSDIERRQEINEVYSQGATNILSFNYQDNCDGSIPAVIPFYIDEDVVNINTCELTFRTNKFRAYSTATHGGGAVVKSTKGGGGIVKATKGGGATTRSTTNGGSSTQTSTSGGGTTATSSSGGGTSKSTNSGGGSTRSSTTKFFSKEMLVISSNPDSGTYAGHTHLVNISGNGSYDHSHNVSIPSHSHSFSTPNHTHSVSIPSHKHKVSIPSHDHSVTIPSHTHEVDLPNHTHEIELPDHTHEVKHEIIELNETASKMLIKVDGNIVNFNGTSGDRVNLVDFMNKDTSGKVTRGKHEVSLSPNSLARVEADLILRVFIQSQLGGNF